MPPFRVFGLNFDAHLLEAFSWLFCHFLGERFTTRVWLYECLINVSEFLQNTSYLNGYGIVYLHFVVIICGLNPRGQAHVGVLVLCPY